MIRIFIAFGCCLSLGTSIAQSQPAKPPTPKNGPLGMKFVPLPKGTTYLGWNGKKNSAKKVEIKEDFEIAIHTVTQSQWQAVMGNNPSYHARAGQGMQAVLNVADEDLKHFPVERVSWHDAQEFIKKLNEKEAKGGFVYRLPTSAEWEYGCRGGATSQEECSFHFYFAKPTNDLSSSQANFNGLAPFGNGALGAVFGRAIKVGYYGPNKLGLCDMHGNVWQWCENPPDPKSQNRMVRGGCFDSIGAQCQAASQVGLPPAGRNQRIGFRVVRVPAPKQ